MVCAGITDDNVVFGISSDPEGRIFINPQGWALLSGAADEEKRAKLMKSVHEQLETPYGVEKLAPSYTAMREDVGRVTQKHPGTAENGAVYNHAAAFYIYGLYAVGEQDQAYRLLRKMLPGPDIEDIIRRGQLPVFIPNYYRGLQAVPADSRTLQPSVQHWNRSLGVPLPDRWAIRPARLPGRPPGEAAASVRLAGGNREAQLQRRGAAY